jgi:hypothetical protein
MLRTPLTLVDANIRLNSLVNLPVSLPWKGHGSAIFLELGVLTSTAGQRRKREKGEANIYVGWDWRIEEGAKVLFGSSNSRPVIEDGISILCGVRIDDLLIQGDVPELLIRFSNGYRLISAAMCDDGSEWSIHLPDDSWMSSDEGVVYIGDGSAIGLSEEEEVLFEHAHQTAKRWGVPVADQKLGDCNNCRWMVRVDGDADFLDYGVCTSADSTFDGQVVNMASGCKDFSVYGS